MHVPARDIFPPASISTQARAYLTNLTARVGVPGADLIGSDEATLRRRIAAFDNAVGEFYAMVAAASNTHVDTQTMGGITVYVAARNEATAFERQKIHLYIHGGAFLYGGGRMAMYGAQMQARTYGGLVISVDYRMPPDYPFPAAPNDCLAVYREILQRHGSSRLHRQPRCI